MKYFILGYLDGDGSIYYTKSKYPQYSIAFVGTDDLLTFINNYFHENNLSKSIAKLCKRREYQTVSDIKFGGNIMVDKILTHLYDNPNVNKICLRRKYERYIKCKNKQFD